MDILGIGNALLDIFSFSDEETALSLGLHPNHASHVSPERFDELLLGIRNPIYVSGGAASNTVKTLAALGASATFIGCTGTEDRERDQWAHIFREDLSSFGVDCLIEDRNGESGRCLVIHMPGNLKAIACAPGAAASIREDQIDSDLISQVKMVYLDGQVLRNTKVTKKIILACETHKIPLGIDISSREIARQFYGITDEILERCDTLLFMNTEEAVALAIALSGTKESSHGTEIITDAVFSAYTRQKKTFPCIIEKRGGNGAYAWHSGEKYEAKTEPVAAVLDDTGAGDVFAGAFIRMFLMEKSITESLAFANSVAKEILAIPGTRLDRDFFSTLKKGFPVSELK